MTTDSYELPELPGATLFEDAMMVGFTDDQMRAYALLAVKAERERCANEFERVAQDVWDAAMSIPPPSDRAGSLAHVSQKLRERAYAIRQQKDK